MKLNFRTTLACAWHMYTAGTHIKDSPIDLQKTGKSIYEKLCLTMRNIDKNGCVELDLNNDEKIAMITGLESLERMASNMQQTK